MIAIASASLLPVPSPNWLNPPQPSPATLTRSPVRPSVVYSIRSPVSVVAVPTYMAIRAVQTARRGGFIDRWPSDGYLFAMSTHTVAETKNQLSRLINRALKGEHIVVTRRGRPVIEFKPVQKNEKKQEKPTPRWTVEEQLEWLRAHRIGRISDKDAATLIREMRDD